MIAEAPPRTSVLPSGAVELGNLVQRYLPFVGFQRNSKLDRSEAVQFAVLAVDKALEKYGPARFDRVEFWIRAIREDGIARIYLLPDTEEAREFQQTMTDETILLTGCETNVGGLVRKIFVNLVEQDRRKEAKQDKVKERLAIEARPAQRRHHARRSGEQEDLFSPDAQSLDGYAESQSLERELAERETTRRIFELAFARMSRKHAHIIQMLIAGENPADVAESFGMAASSVRSVVHHFRKLYKEVEKEFESSG